jgi:hypothetical protein
MERRLLQPGSRLFRGNLHTHTTASDGSFSAEQAIGWYRDEGYDFLAITDHWHLYEKRSADGLLVIPGMEFDGRDPELGPFHIVGLNLSRAPSWGQGTAAMVAGHIAEAGGQAVLCHPYWCGMPSTAAQRIPGVFAMEVFNSTCEVMIAKGLSSSHWDDVLAAGKRLWGLAVDDTHWHWPDRGGGWVMVQAEELTVSSVLDALVSGRFYSTQGPDILDFYVAGGTAYASTTASRRIAFLCDGWRGRCVRPADGAEAVRQAEMPLPEGASYVRLEVDDAAGRRAWSNPIFLTE